MSSIYSVFLNGIHEGNHFTMTYETLNKLQDWVDNNTEIYDESEKGEIHSTYIAENVTDLQCKKFVNFVSDYTEVTRQLVKDHYYYMNYEGGDREFRVYNSVDEEVKDSFSDNVLEDLDISKWNPRSVLGRLEFDRRSEEAGIVFAE